ncbi:MAG: hypothetical protein RL186_1167 [Pseudomonadota bacterium]
MTLPRTRAGVNNSCPLLRRTELGLTTVETPFFKDRLNLGQEKRLRTHFGDGSAYTKVL